MVEPETRSSLLLRLREPQDQHAWAEFVSIYQPLVFRIMKQRGLQDADAHDVTQQVIVAVNQAVPRWQPDGRSASFRRWLFSIARRMALRFLERGQKGCATGGSDMLEWLEQLPEPQPKTTAVFDDQYRSEVFRWAAEQVRSEFRETTWQAFWRTCVLNEPVAEVADRLQITSGNVYVARCRIIARLRKVVEQFEQDHDGPSCEQKL